MGSRRLILMAVVIWTHAKLLLKDLVKIGAVGIAGLLCHVGDRQFSLFEQLAGVREPELLHDF